MLKKPLFEPVLLAPHRMTAGMHFTISEFRVPAFLKKCQQDEVHAGTAILLLCLDLFCWHAALSSKRPPFIHICIIYLSLLFSYTRYIEEYWTILAPRGENTALPSICAVPVRPKMLAPMLAPVEDAAHPVHYVELVLW